MSTNILLEAPLPPQAVKRRVVAYLGFGLLLVVVVLAFLGPLFATHDPTQANALEALQPPGARHWLGTNSYGGDIFSRVVSAARLDLFIGFVSVASAFVIAAPLGTAVGYSRAWWASVTMRAMDFIQSFPVFILAMAIVSVRGPGTFNVILVIALLNVPIFVRLIRAEVLSLRERAFVDAARAVGNSGFRLVTRHIMPNALGPSIAQASANIGWALLLTAGLSFVGAGIRPPTPEWGTMIAEGAQNMITGEWWISLFPGLALGTAVLGFALAGDALRALLDVRARTV
jgi:peptide/nickel transport system permease protein